jgi:carboxylate-amine ligase
LTHTAESLRATFDAPAPLTVGIEEELMLLDPETLDLAPLARETLDRTPEGDGRFKLELPAAQLEIASPALRSAAAAREFLQTARADLAASTDGFVKLACAGVHPFAREEGTLNAEERYIHTLREYGRLARRQLVFGLQVHVAVRPAGKALALYNAMRDYLPELLALAANAPYYRGEDTGLATVRPKLCELLPRQGVPPPIESWEQHADALAWGARAGNMRDAGVWWWELRPHPTFGTLEVRVPDAQRTVDDACAIVATVHALAKWLGARHDAGELENRTPAPTWRIEENRWQATRHGLDAALADLETGEPRPARERLAALLEQIEPHAGPGELKHAAKLAERNGADLQRAQFEEGGIPQVMAWLTNGFISPETGHA